MKNGLLGKLLPHVVAILIFVIVSVLFCKPVLDGNVLNQVDDAGWRGGAQNAFDYKAKHGHFPLWNTNLFSGMPNYQTMMEGKTILPDITKIMSLALPKPINFFFLACICFYILCLCLRLHPVIGIAGALAYAFSTYNPVIIGVGHDSKMLAIAYMPLLLAGIMLIFEKKYWLGLALTTLGTYLEIGVIHPQINYYFFLTAAGITISYLFQWIKNKEWKHLGIAIALVAVAGGVGLAANSLSLLTSSEYAKATMRGGKNIHVEGDKVTAVNTTGLDPDYAFSYSMRPAEPLVLFMPNAFGGSSSNALKETSNVVGKLADKGVPENTALQIATSLPAYWGGMTSPGEVGTAGPPYIGVIIFLLALVGFVIIPHPVKWGLLAITILAIVMSWGKYFPGFNLFLLESLPLYDKFRAPSMILVIPAITLPVTAVLALKEIFRPSGNNELNGKSFRTILYVFGGFFVLLGIIYLGIEYTSGFDSRIVESIKSNGGNDDIARATLSGIKADRSAMLGGSIMRTLLFAVLVIGLLWLYLKKTIKNPVVILVILGLANIIDLLIVDSDYLNQKNYQPQDEVQAANFTKTAADDQLLQDKDPNFRVFNASGDRFQESRTSYFHKSIGGYHPAKLRIYQDLIERYLSENPNQQVLNMLNARYVLVQNPQNGQLSAVPRPGAYGSCWLVKNVKIVKDDVAEIQAVGTTDLRDTAIVQQSFAGIITQPQWDSASTITLTKFDNDVLEYSADCRAPQFAVFSEVYYPFGWNAYIDGKKTEYAKTNYALRGLSVPAGKHTIRFAFEPAAFRKGNSISYAASYLVALIFLGGLFMAWRENKTKAKTS